MPKNNPLLAKRMEGLRQEYLLSLPERKEKIATFIKACEAGEPSSEECKTACMEAHKFSGSGKMFGYENMSEIAYLLEGALLEEKKNNYLPLAKALLRECEQMQENNKNAVADDIASANKDKTTAPKHPTPQNAGQKIVPVVLSGGSGTRLWPMSRESYPKQFLGVINSKIPIIQDTINRILNPALFHPPVMVGKDSHRFLLAEHMRKCGIESPEIIIEPCARGTAPAITAAALYIREHYGDALMLVMPTDHHMAEDLSAFLDGVKHAAKVASEGYLVTFGIAPTEPETGYGYIQRGEALKNTGDGFEIASFVEKPDLEKAKEFVSSGEYFWNSGMFMFPADLFLEEMRSIQPELLKACEQAVSKSVKDLDFTRLDEPSFAKCDDTSIDYALMEHTKRAAVVPLNCGWSDTGAWDLLWQISPKDKNGNAILGECYTLDSKDCYIRSENGPSITTFGVDNLVVIATKDAVMVADKEKAHSLKKLIAHLKKQNPELVRDNYRTYRPWGMYENIHQGNRFQVKRLTVKPGQKLSLQMHQHRAEHWIVVSGTGKMTCDDIAKMVTENQSFYVPLGGVHSIENPGKIDLEIIEVQSGAYLGEDDIVRFEDKYGRVDAK